MIRYSRAIAVAVAAACVAGAPAWAGGADQARARMAGFRQLGAAYKAVTDGVRAGDLAKIRQGSGQISGAARGMYGWFPRGSGPQAGIKTLVKPDVWTRAGEFRAAQDAFARQAQAFQRVVAGGDINAIRSEARRLGATCKGCHDSFKAAGD